MSADAHDRTDEWPRIGEAAVEPEALASPGISLADLATELGAQVDMDAAANAPSEGWRVLRRMNNESLILGAPAAEGRWHVAWLQLAHGDRTIRPLQETQPLRPSIAEQREGLELRPSTVWDSQDFDHLAVDVVNISDRNWMPQGERLHAIGVFTQPGQTSFHFGWADHSGTMAVVLGPGDYARIPVQINSSVWRDMTPGPHDLHVLVVGLGLRLSPQRVDISAAQIAAHARTERRHNPAVERRMLTQQIDSLRLSLRLSRSLPEVAELLSSASSEAQAAERLAGVLDCTPEETRSVLHSPLSVALPFGTDDVEQQIARLTARLDQL